MHAWMHECMYVLCMHVGMYNMYVCIMYAAMYIWICYSNFHSSGRGTV